MQLLSLLTSPRSLQQKGVKDTFHDKLTRCINSIPELIRSLRSATSMQGLETTTLIALMNSWYIF